MELPSTQTFAKTCTWVPMQLQVSLSAVSGLAKWFIEVTCYSDPLFWSSYTEVALWWQRGK
jgi:hypothetical protein